MTLFSEIKSDTRGCWYRYFIQYEYSQLLILVTLAICEFLHWQLSMMKESKLKATEVYECEYKYLEGGFDSMVIKQDKNMNYDYGDIWFIVPSVKALCERDLIYNQEVFI